MEEYIEKEKEKYKKLGYVECPVFNYEKIYFNKHGLRHLTRKNGIPRPLLEQRRKFMLMRYVPEVLSKLERVKGASVSGEVCFWTLEHRGYKRTLIVIIRQITDNPKHFYSVMDKKNVGSKNVTP